MEASMLFLFVVWPVDICLRAAVPFAFMRMYGWKALLPGYGIKIFLEYITSK